MVIDTNNVGSTGSANSARSHRTTAVGTNTAKAYTPAPENPASSGVKDEVVLSPQAQNLTRLQSKINSQPDVDLEKVAAIKKAIAEGRFEINPERIAENMLKQDELLS